MATPGGKDVLMAVLGLGDELREASATQGQLLEQLQDNNARAQRTLTRLAKALQDSHGALTDAYDSLERRVAALETRER